MSATKIAGNLPRLAALRKAELQLRLSWAVLMLGVGFWAGFVVVAILAAHFVGDTGFGASAILSEFFVVCGQVLIVVGVAFVALKWAALRELREKIRRGTA